MYVLGHIQARVNLECHSLLSLVFYETVTILKLTDQARLTGSSPRTCLPCLPVLGLHVCTEMLDLFSGSGDKTQVLMFAWQTLY